MLYRKIGNYIEKHLTSDSDQILVIEGARQVGKSFIIRKVGERLFRNFIEINLVEDYEGRQLFRDVRTTENFYFTLSMIAGEKMGDASDTLVFIDEIQQYPQFLTMLKFLRQEKRFTYIVSGSLLGIGLRQTTSIPIGSIIIKQMYQLDFEEFLLANGFGSQAIQHLKNCYLRNESLDESTHQYLMQLFRRYLLVGGMPDAVNEYLATRNIVRVRAIQDSIHSLYGADAVKYEESADKKLHVKRIYDLVPSQMENKKKRMVIQEIQGRKGDRFSNYFDDFEYLISSGIVLDVRAVSNPTYPLKETEQKNLLKLYLNDVGLLTAELYHEDLQPVLQDQLSINLGAVYESVVAQELKAHGHQLYYYDNRKLGEVDYLIDDNVSSGILPIEVKSGKDYAVHQALNNLLSIPDYHVASALVLSNERVVSQKGKIAYMPIYYVMFVGQKDKESVMTDF